LNVCQPFNRFPGEGHRLSVFLDDPAQNFVPVNEYSFRSLDTQTYRAPTDLDDNNPDGGTDIDALADLTGQNENGILLPIGSVKSIEQDIAGILQDVPAGLGRHLKKVLGKGHAGGRLWNIHILRLASQDLEIGFIFFKS